MITVRRKIDCSTCRARNSSNKIMNSFAGDYNERCLENDMAERCSLENIENGSENYNNCSEDYNNCTEDYNKCNEDYNNCTEEYSNECQNQYHQDEYSNQYEDGGQQMHYAETKGPEILYKSSKELYKAVAKQCGLQCKMTDTCR
jgi:Domain of unknown function (DUF4802)